MLPNRRAGAQGSTTRAPWNHLIPGGLSLKKKKSNLLHFQLLGKAVLFADTVICNSIPTPPAAMASSLTEKSREKQAMGWRGSLFHEGVESQLPDGPYGHTGSQGQDAVTCWQGQVLVLLSTY